MPKGQAQTVWFPELKEILRDKWTKNYSIVQQFVLVDELNAKLTEIITEGNMKPAMMWCSTCQAKIRGAFTNVTITSMFFALKRFEICSENEFKRLRRDWNKYSKAEGINIYGEPIEMGDEKKKTRKHNNV